MRYYVIINGVNSLTIEGLAIKTLPPISKPAMRNIREEIDGRDGDITTELGYGAYDRILEIGLYGAYDINKIISFFNSKGTIIFSDEPDKYYNFEIVDRIDYTKLVKFRTAMINIHCQPFKYPVTEEPQVEEFEYVEGTGEELTLDNTAEAILNKIELSGNTKQIQYTGKQQFDKDNPNTLVGYIDGNGTIVSAVSNYLVWVQIQPNTNYAIKFTQIALSTSAYIDDTQIGLFATTPALNVTGERIYSKSRPSATQDYTYECTFNSGNNTYVAIKLANTQRTDTTKSSATLQIDKSTTIGDYEPYVGGIPAPNPDYPEPIHVVTGDNTIKITGRNLFNPSNTNHYAFGSTGTPPQDWLLYSTTYIGYALPCKEGDVFSISRDATTNPRFRAMFSKSAPGAQVSLFGGTGNTNTYDSALKIENLEAPQGAKYLNIYLSNAGGMLPNIMINKGPTALPFEEYQSETFPINLGNLEMAAIPNTNYKDVFIKDGDTWYKREALEKIILDGSEQNWNSFKDGGNIWNYYRNYPNLKKDLTNLACISNYFTYNKTSQNNKIGEFSVGGNNPNKNGNIVINPFNDTTNLLNNFKSWLGTHPTTFYYPLETITDIEIASETLADQLEAIKNAISYSGQTNISQTNNDAPFILDVSALKEGSDHLVINNSGNIYAKPTMDIEGTGVVDIYLNDVQILEADLTETNNIVIDTESMEAYNPDTNTLANRQVTGDYSKIKLEPGENDLRFSGALSKATITNYKRWL